MLDDSYETMRDIGHEYGLTSHKLGKLLAEQGFREGGRPTTKAHRHGWVNQRFAPDGPNYIWAWHVGNVRACLNRWDMSGRWLMARRIIRPISDAGKSGTKYIDVGCNR